jgi:hypothetical protein
MLNKTKFPMSKLSIAVSMTVGISFLTNVAIADERESLEQLKATTTNLIELLVKEGVLPKDKAEAMMKKAASDAAIQVKQAKVLENTKNAEDLNRSAAEKTVHVQYVPEHIKKQMREDIEKEVMTNLNYKAGERLAMPEWIDRLQWEGNIRIRAESDRFASGNSLPTDFSNSPTRNARIDNTTEDRNRLRLRAQLGLTYKVNDWLSGGIRITTGEQDNPVSPNQTQETASAKYNIALDRAYVKFEPKNWLEVSAGRFKSPWYSTDLVWDPDLAFDGVAATFKPEINKDISSFVTLGAFPIDEINSSNTNLAKDKWLYGAQAGINWRLPNKSLAKFGIAYYDFENTEGISNGTSIQGAYDATVPAFRQKGNSTFDINKGNASAAKYALASKFQLININGQLDLATFDPYHVILNADYVKNIGFDKADIKQRTGADYKEETDGYQVKLTVGMPSILKAHDWQVFGAYKYLEADAVVDAYTDSDFNLGGTNAKGWILGGNYGIDKNAWVSARWFSTNEITSFSDGGLPLSIDVLMLDLNTKF